MPAAPSPMGEITRSETSERARLLHVDGYEVTLDLTGGPETFRSTSVITFDCRERGAASYADLIAGQVVEISLNGTALDPAIAWADGRITLPDLAARNELRVVAHCRYSADGTGMHRFADPADGRVYTYTKFEPAYARTVYACFEQPDLKAAFTINVLVPAHWTVLSNEAAAVPPGKGGPGKACMWRFPPTPRLPTYQFEVVAGEYAVVSGSHTTPRGQVIPLGLACRQSLAQFLEAEDIFAVTRQGLDYYTELFERDYPFGKYDQAFVPEFSAGATESAGCVVWTDDLLFRSRVTDTMLELRASVALHEMAHMWFGDMVTMKWWDDLWLNEAFAEFCAALSSAEATRFTDAWATFSVLRKTWGYQQDQLPSTHPVAADVETLSEAIANFDGISYAKGGSVLRQLMARLGRDAFFAGIRGYFAEHAWGNATLTDLLAALESSSGARLADWSDAWLRTTGPSTLGAEFELDGAAAGAAFRSLDVVQASATPRPHRIAIGLYRNGAGGLRRTHQVTVDVSGERTAVPELAGVPQPDLLLVNDEDLTYAVLRFDDRSLRTLLASIAALADPLARAVCWGSLIDMVRRAELAVPVFVGAVARAMAAEPAVAALQALLDATCAAVDQLADPARVAGCRSELAAAAVPLLTAAGAGSDHQLAWVQLLCRTASSAGELDLLAGLRAGREHLPGLHLDADLRWAMLRRLAATGRAGIADIDAEHSADVTDSGARHAAACRAAMPDASQKAAAWRLLTDGDLPVASLAEISSAFHQPEQAGLLAPYAQRYFDVLPELWAARTGHLRIRLADALFPRTAAGPGLIAQIERFLAGGPRDPSLVRVLAERRDVAERALRSRSLP